jgi:hypothetical protein
MKFKNNEAMYNYFEQFGMKPNNSPPVRRHPSPRPATQAPLRPTVRRRVLVRR